MQPFCPFCPGQKRLYAVTRSHDGQRERGNNFPRGSQGRSQLIYIGTKGINKILGPGQHSTDIPTRGCVSVPRGSFLVGPTP
jgi:hypothetical protein